MSFRPFFDLIPHFSNLKKNALPADGQTDGPTDGRTHIKKEERKDLKRKMKKEGIKTSWKEE